MENTNYSCKVKFGMALKFLKIGNQVYAIIKTANKKRPFTSDMELQAKIDNFF
jgi:hypothetical protein